MYDPTSMYGVSFELFEVYKPARMSSIIFRSISLVSFGFFLQCLSMCQCWNFDITRSFIENNPELAFLKIHSSDKNI